MAAFIREKQNPDPPPNFSRDLREDEEEVEHVLPGFEKRTMCPLFGVGVSPSGGRPENRL